MKRLGGWRAVLLVFVVFASACGGSSDDESAQVATSDGVDAEGDVASSDSGDDEGSTPISADTSSATIGAAGGSVTSDDGVLTVDIPAGALSEDTLITVAPAPDFVTPPLGDGEQLGLAYELGPDGLAFEAPVTVSFDIETPAEGVPVVIPVSTTADGGTEGLVGVSISNEGGSTVVSGETTHFSWVFAAAIGATVTMAPAFPSRFVGDWWISGIRILWSTGAAVGLSGVDAASDDPAVAASLGAIPDGEDWAAEFECVGIGRTKFSADVGLELTNVIAQFFANLLPGYSGSATVTLEGEAECLDAPDDAPPPADCSPATLGDPSADGTVPVTINNECLDPLFFAFNNANSSDPFWHVHTQQDDIFLSLELYTLYGSSWSGDTGTFPLDCNEPWGLCAIFDADGVGPEPAVMWAGGEISISRLDDGGYDVSFAGVFPPTPGGTAYDLQSVSWAS